MFNKESVGSLGECREKQWNNALKPQDDTSPAKILRH